MFGKTKIAALVAEFFGTGILTLVILSTLNSQLGYSFFVASAAGLALAFLVYTFGKASGGHFNPAITLGFLAVRRITPPKAVVYLTAQFLGAWAAYGLYTYYLKTESQAPKIEFDWHIFVAEAVGAGIFAFGVASAVYQNLSRAATAAFVGISLTIGALASTAAVAYQSLGFINPAVSFGILRGWYWAYIFGPILGAIIGMLLYDLLFADSDEKKPAFKTASLASVNLSLSSSKKPVSKTKATKASKTKSTTKKKSSRK